MDASELHGLVEVLGDAPRVSYAPFAIYPMAAPDFEPAQALSRGDPPPGPIGVYVHVPFCNYRCSFCFYATQKVPGAAQTSRYVSALERELSWLPSDAPLQQLYVGGGTPTTLPPALLDRLLAAVLERLGPSGEVHTVEGSPESVTDAHVEVLQRRGIERVSLGVQTGDADLRRSIHRRHDDAQILAALDRLVGGGLMVNVDLIYGLPEQTEEGFRSDFEWLAERGIHSITTYNLRVNEQTPIARRITDAQRLDMSRLVRWRERIRAVARDCGFEQTRWHTYQRTAPDTAASVVARFRDVTGWGNQLGAGLSARSRLGDCILRNDPRLSRYLERVEAGRSPVAEQKRLDPAERRLRLVTLTLGDGRALDRDEYQATFGTRFDDDFGEARERLVAAGILDDDGHSVALSERGRLVHDLAMRVFYPSRVLRWMEARQAAGAPAQKHAAAEA